MTSIEDLFPQIDEGLQERLLSDPVNQEVAKAYAAAEEERKYSEIWAPAAEGDVTLQAIIAVGRLTGKNPFEKWRDMVAKMKAVPAEIAEFQIDYIAAKVSQDDDACEELEPDRILADMLTAIAPGALQLYPIALQFYAELAVATRKIAAEERINPIKAAQMQGISDRAIRKVFPSREKAETYYNSVGKLMTKVLEVSFEAIEILSSRDPNPMGEILLSRKERLKSTLQADSYYDIRQLDRIYGSAQQAQN